MFKICLRFGCFFAVAFLAVATPVLPGMKNKDLYHGDIKLTKEQEQILANPDAQTGLTDARSRWPTNILGFVEVPFRIRQTDGFSE